MGWPDNGERRVDGLIAIFQKSPLDEAVRPMTTGLNVVTMATRALPLIPQ
jgi:hypothetical protein